MKFKVGDRVQFQTTQGPVVAVLKNLIPSRAEGTTDHALLVISVPSGEHYREVEIYVEVEHLEPAPNRRVRARRTSSGWNEYRDYVEGCVIETPGLYGPVRGIVDAIDECKTMTVRILAGQEPAMLSAQCREIRMVERRNGQERRRA